MRTLSTLLMGSAMALGAILPAHAQDEASVTIVLSEELDLVEPCMASRSNIGRVVLQNISETLTELDARESGLLPRLAASWEAVDEDTWRFHLQEGVSFHNGEAFDANDVKFSIERTLNPDLTCEIASKYFGGIEITTEVVNDTTIDITANPAQPILPVIMSTLTIVPDTTDATAFTRDPVGTGPYVLAEWNVGQNIILERNDGYWGETPEVQKATYVFRTDSAVAAAMVETGEADIVPNIAVQDATNPETDFSYPNSETSRFRIDMYAAPTDDRRVREALNLAIDRDAFRGTVLSPDVIPATQLVVPTTIGYNSDLQVWPYNPDRARELLAEAKADGVAVDTEIKIIGRTNIYPNGTEVAEATMQMLQDVGFNVSLQMYDVAEWENFFSKPYAEDRGPQLVQAQHDNAKGDPVFTVFFKYHSEGLQSTLADPAVDDLIARATVATGDERTALWQEVFAKINDEIISDIPLFHMVGYSRVSPRLDFQPTIATNSELQLSQISFK